MRYLLSYIFIMISLCSFTRNNETVHLWPGKVPGEAKAKYPPMTADSRNDNVLRYSEITDPAIEVFLPDQTKRNGAAVIICPGGGYRILAWDKEGTEIAEWLNKLGFTAFVLQYRIPDKKEGALQDVMRAIRIVRNGALKWNIDPEKTGVIGFSAGGSLCARVSTNFGRKTYDPVDSADSLSCRPSFSMLIYPAYLDLGSNHSLTLELQLSKVVPPMFLFQTADDTFANSSIVMAAAMRDAKLPVELHLLPDGGHGYGLRPGIRAAETWPLLAEKWMNNILRIKQPATGGQ
jgi:acetyl esterase/lipase